MKNVKATDEVPFWVYILAIVLLSVLFAYVVPVYFPNLYYYMMIS